jgi:phosphopantothenoylcysteine decarboxylase / phosphopantothenate---cysteine ligase
MPKTAVIGITGGIAAYKSAYLTSLLKKKGYDVHVILTENALKFVTALTFETLSGNAAVTDTFERAESFDVKHVTLAKKADMFIIAPATADVIGKIASGIADDMLTTTLLAAECPVVLAPAMNTAMYQSPTVQENIKTLKNRGYHIMDTGEGLLACGDTGQGRMIEPEEILEYIEEIFKSLYDMQGVRVLVTAGPTKEAIDPVRFLSNNSSGKMGYAIAQAALDRGADVTLVSGPVALESPGKAKHINVVSAQDMYDAVIPMSGEYDIIIMTAAVADYKPAVYSGQKIKKGGDIAINLVRTKDILKSLGEKKGGNQVLVGFAAETQDFESNAISKLKSKNLDIIALNDVSREGEGFGSDSNNIKLFFRDGRKTDIGSGEKSYLSKKIVQEAYELHKSLR